MSNRFPSLQALEAQIGRPVLVDAGSGRARAVTAIEKYEAQAAALGVRIESSVKKVRMNKTETRYQNEILLPAQRTGLVQSFMFESLNFRLGERTNYRPDFVVSRPDGKVELHEIKGGFIRDDAKMKFKVAADKYFYFVWQMWQWKDGVWTMILEL